MSMFSTFPTKEHKDRQVSLFQLIDGTDVFYGDILWHPDSRNVGWYCTAEYSVNNFGYATVRSPNGAVPSVDITELRRMPPPPPPRCSECGQLLS